MQETKDGGEEHAKKRKTYTPTEMPRNLKNAALMYHDSIPEFDPHEVYPHNAFISVFGRRGIGKTFWADWFCSFLRDVFDVAIVITNTKFNNFWTRRVGPEFVVSPAFPHGSRAVENLLKRQEIMVSKNGNAWKMPNLRYHPNKALIIFDDIISQRQSHSSNQILKCAVEGRHLDVMVLLLTNYPKAIGTEARECTDYGVIFGQRTQNAREFVAQQFLSGVTHPADGLSKIEDHRQKMKFLEDYTSGHDCLITVQKAKNTSDITQLYRSCTKATEPPTYFLGNKEQKKYAAQSLSNQRK